MDLALVINPSTREFDLAMNGSDLATDDTLETAIILSLFTDRRADADDVVPDDDPAHPGAGDRRGWWGDWYSPDMLPAQLAGGAVNPPADRIGSRLWLLRTAAGAADAIARGTEYAEEALQWLVDQGIASAVNVTVSAPFPGELVFAIQVVRNGRTDTHRFDYVWGT